jgi:hypothetical protein
VFVFGEQTVQTGNWMVVPADAPDLLPVIT